MAVEFPGQIISLPVATTGIPQYRFVTVSTAGNVILTVSNGPSIGVTQAGTTGSTVDPTGSLPVMVSGVSKLAVSTASTCGVGEVIAATSRGSIKPAAAASHIAGMVVAGSSGGAGRVVSVLIAGVSASTALA